MKITREEDKLVNDDIEVLKYEGTTYGKGLWEEESYRSGHPLELGAGRSCYYASMISLPSSVITRILHLTSCISSSHEVKEGKVNTWRGANWKVIREKLCKEDGLGMGGQELIVGNEIMTTKWKREELGRINLWVSKSCEHNTPDQVNNHATFVA